MMLDVLSPAKKLALPVTVLFVTLGVPGCSAPGSATVPEDQRLTVGCEIAREHPAVPVKDTDLAVGDFRYAGMAAGVPTPDDEPLPPTEDGNVFYQLGAQLSQGEATVTVGDSAQDYARLVVEGAPSTGFTQITYQVCEYLSEENVNWWFGGIVLEGRDSSCVPLEVSVKGGPTETVEVALPRGACASAD